MYYSNNKYTYMNLLHILHINAFLNLIHSLSLTNLINVIPNLYVMAYQTNNLFTTQELYIINILLLSPLSLLFNLTISYLLQIPLSYPLYSHNLSNYIITLFLLILVSLSNYHLIFFVKYLIYSNLIYHNLTLIPQLSNEVTYSLNLS